MKNPAKIKRALRLKRHTRIRAQVTGTGERPRFSIFRSSKHIWAQLIDDTQRKTLVAASTKELKRKTAKTKREEALLVGKLLAEKAAKVGIKEVTFDRGGYRFHGRVAAVAEGARKNGLKF